MTNPSPDIPQSLLDKLVPDYRAFIQSQPASSRTPLHTLTWSPSLRRPVNLGSAPPVPVGSTRKIDLGKFSVLALTPEGERPSEGWPVYMYVHGGGWVFGNVESGNGIYSRMCVEARCVVVSVDYRLAPENPFPAAVDDAWEALLWLRGAGKDALGIDVSRIAIGGISAGGNLAAVLAQRASLNTPRIPLVLQLLLIPALNLSLDASDKSTWTPTMIDQEHVWALRTLDVFWYRDLYIPNSRDWTNVDASPLLQDDKRAYEGMAPAWVGVMELDVLRSEGEVYAEKMRVFGVDVVLKEYKGATHPLVEADGVCELARTIRADQTEALKTAFAK